MRRLDARARGDEAGQLQRPLPNIPCSGSSPAAEREDPPPDRAQPNLHCRLMDRVGQAVVCLGGKAGANMNWIKCTDMNKQPIYVNIENATSIFGSS